MPKLPPSVQIGATTYTVIVEENLHAVEGDRRQALNGHIMYDPAHIKVEKALCVDRQRITVMHEVIHGILESMGQDDHSEQMVRALGHGITDFMRRNPEFVAYVMGENDE